MDRTDESRVLRKASAMTDTDTFRLVVPPDRPDAHNHRALPGIYCTTFSMCKVFTIGKRYRLLVRFAMEGPLESESPRTLLMERDVTVTASLLRREFRSLGVDLVEGGSLDEACATVKRRVEYVNVYLHLREDGQRELQRERLTREEVDARLRGETPSPRRMRIAPALLLSATQMQDGAKLTRAARRKLARPVIFWATIIRCEAFPLQGSAGYEVAWEVRIDAYDDAPIIHRWKQCVDRVQAYEELRRDFEVLCVDLESYQDIERACRAALGQNVIVEYPLAELAKAKTSLLEHFTDKPHQLPPLQRRMTRKSADAYCRNHGLEAFAEDLKQLKFKGEVHAH